MRAAVSGSKWNSGHDYGLSIGRFLSASEQVTDRLQDFLIEMRPLFVVPVLL